MRVAVFDTTNKSPKQPQSSTGKIVALKKVRIVKKVIDNTENIDTKRMRTLKVSIHPIINSAPHNQIEKTMLIGESHSIPYIERYSFTFRAVPHGSTALTKPEKMKHTPTITRQMFDANFNPFDAIPAYFR